MKFKIITQVQSAEWTNEIERSMNYGIREVKINGYN
jgi:hypothetical protein